MWDEYQNGAGGRKPARKFTRSERGQKNADFKYSGRLIVWKCIESLIDKHNTLSTAFTQIRGVYDHCVMTQLINKMSKDERRGGHARLRVYIQEVKKVLICNVNGSSSSSSSV